jgi:hypothetical protein
MPDIPHERWALRLAVISVCVVDTVGTAGACALVYLVRSGASPHRSPLTITRRRRQYGVTFWGNPAAQARGVYWPYMLVIATTSWTALIVHLFLLRRIWILYAAFTHAARRLFIHRTQDPERVHRGAAWPAHHPRGAHLPHSKTPDFHLLTHGTSSLARC